MENVMKKVNWYIALPFWADPRTSRGGIVVVKKTNLRRPLKDVGWFSLPCIWY